VRVRSAKLLDLGQIEEIYRLGDGKISEVAPPIRLWSIVSHTLSALMPLTQEALIYVAEEDGRVVGFVQAAGKYLTGINLPLAAGSSLQVLGLCVAPGSDPEEVAPALVEHLCNRALARGVHRLFVRLPLDDALTPVFRMQGFRQYATETVVYAEQPRALSDAVPAGVRPARSRDARQLYQLYRKVTPPAVAQVEAPTYKEWKLLREDSGQQLVVDRVELVGWLRLQKAAQARPHTLAFLALPEPHLPDQLADHALTLAGPGAAWSSLRHYDADMIDALRGRGFSTLIIQALLVKELAVRVPLAEKGLVPSFG
jgi:GNAT superfamily N-acetyltransferase